MKLDELQKQTDRLVIVTTWVFRASLVLVAATLSLLVYAYAR